MTTSKPICNPCSREELSPVVAIKYCTDCEENLCKACLNAHSSFKACAAHHLIDPGSLPKEKLSVQSGCKKHDEMALDFFCVEHDCLCCRSCMAETHRTCQKCVPVDVASKGVRRSFMLEDVSSTVSSLRGTLKTLISNRNDNLKSLNDEESDVLRNVSLIKSKLLERLDELEKKVISEIKSAKTKCEKQIQSDKETLSTLMESLDEVTSKLELVSKHGSENQLFILLNSYKWKISDFDIKVQKIIASMFNSKISLKKSPQQQLQIESFGSVHIESTPCPIKFKPSKSNQAQVLPTTIQMPTKFDFDMKFYIKSTDNVWITSIAVTDDNRLLLCGACTKLLVYSDHGEYLQDCTLSGAPWGIAIIPGEDKAVVSLPVKESIQFVDIQSMKSGGTHSVPGMYGGIAVVGDKICVDGTGGKINILSKQGKTITTITVPGGGEINYLHPGPQDSVYYADYYNTVGCVKLSGEVRFTCKPENFNKPKAVTTDRGGNLYIACCDSNNIRRLSVDGNVIDIVLDHNKKISQPCGLTFSRNYRTLFVTNEYGKSVSVFSCS